PQRVVARLPFPLAMAAVVCRRQELHADVGRRQVVDRRSCRLEHSQCASGIRDVHATNYDADPLWHRLDARRSRVLPAGLLPWSRFYPLLHRRQRTFDSADNRVMPLTLRFLGAAKTVTGSQYLLETDQAKVLIDCGMFQGTPEERIRNNVPFAYEP